MPFNINIQVSASSLTAGVDPWPGCEQKQMTDLAGYCTNGRNNTWVWRTLVSLGPPNNVPWTFHVPSSIPPPMTQWPKQFLPTIYPTFSLILFKNNAPFVCWPQVLTASGNILWDGRTQEPADEWRLSTGRSCALSLVDTANYLEGGMYSVNLACDQDTYPPFSGWMKASKQNAL